MALDENQELFFYLVLKTHRMQLQYLYANRKTIILLSFLFLHFNCKKANTNDIQSVPQYAINYKIDSLIQEGKSVQNSKKKRLKLLGQALKKTNILSTDSLKSKYYSNISLIALSLKDSLFFRTVNSKSLLLSTHTKDSIRMADAHWDLATFFNSKGIKDSSYFHYNAALKIHTLLKNDITAGRLLYNMAKIQASIGDYLGSEITTIKAIELFKPHKDYKRLVNCYNMLGATAISLKAFERALANNNKALFYIKKSSKDPMSELTILNNIGVLYQRQHKYEKSISYYSQVLSYDSIYFKNPKLYAKALNNLGHSNLHLNVISDLPHMFNKAFAIFDSIGDLSGKSNASQNLSLYYLKQRDSSKAIVKSLKAKKLAKTVNDNESLLEALNLLVKIDTENSISYTQEYISLNDSLQQQERINRNKFARIRFETDELSAENKLVNAENQLLEKQNQLWAGIAVIVLLIAASIFIIISQRTKNRILKFKQKQQASNQEIFNLLLAQKKNIEEGKKMEQKRISEELHDGVLGKMLGARMMLIGLNKKVDQEAITKRAKAISVLQGIEAEVRSISHELSHAAYQKINDFIISIKDLVKTIENSSKININFKFSETLDYDTLTGDIKINLYRMVQEIIQNSVKHSECDTIDVNFLLEIKTLKVIIQDNGKGFVIKKGKKGIGMRNIESRITKLNGNWNLDSDIGKGTKVILKIPLTFSQNSTQNILTPSKLQEN